MIDNNLNNIIQQLFREQQHSSRLGEAIKTKMRFAIKIIKNLGCVFFKTISVNWVVNYCQF